jgi:simple sugar transport system ATP-binding protein
VIRILVTNRFDLGRLSLRTLRAIFGRELVKRHASRSARSARGRHLRCPSNVRGGMSIATDANGVVLEARGLSKAYGAVVAIKSVDLAIRREEILAIVGDNGAGKSTLIRMLAGAVRPDKGEILHRGEKVHFESPHHARARGIETVWQELALVPEIDVAENLYVGREVLYGGRWVRRLVPILNRRAMVRGAEERLRALEITIPGGAGMPIKALSGGQRQAVAVARASTWATDVLFMDEPTAALGVQQSKAVLSLARRVADRGLAVVMISHTLPHVMDFADRIVVLRHGRKVADLARGEATAELLVSLIVGFESGTVDESDDLFVSEP